MPRKITMGVPLNNNMEGLISEPHSIMQEYEVPAKDKTDLVEYSEILKTLIAQFPTQMLFSIKEAAEVLSVSQEFIRKKIADGAIKSVNLGDRKMISINELSLIIYEGI